ncbi:hypothetical protein AV530_005671 [Patagioenas fasciata monilis]|uniref:Uncharacterized protein n=1 Tax=Patagioenas fasciata monilis TaxID=372326 RepID=A0A1V4JNJ0_PATFA|nr:hypothetical protein AV530_005671 [Patagioenas fasciata monilis]
MSIQAALQPQLHPMVVSGALHCAAEGLATVGDLEIYGNDECDIVKINFSEEAALEQVKKTQVDEVKRIQECSEEAEQSNWQEPTILSERGDPRKLRGGESDEAREKFLKTEKCDCENVIVGRRTRWIQK